MTALLGLGLTVSLLGSSQDHLIPDSDDLTAGKLKTYREIWEKKLFVSAGDLARFVHVGGGVDEEYAISVHSKPKRRNPDEYWLTVKKSPVSLWECVAATDKSKRVNPENFRISRCDILLPKSTAMAIHKAWLVMLLRTRPDPNRYVVLDSTTELFYVNHGGKLLRGKLPLDAKENALGLFQIAAALATSCKMSPAELTTHLRNVESAAATLVERANRER